MNEASELPPSIERRSGTAVRSTDFDRSGLIGVDRSGLIGVPQGTHPVTVCNLNGMDSVWVYCKVFLDRAAALDRGPGKSVEVRTAWAAHSDRLD